jgi:hypothetical protein
MIEHLAGRRKRGLLFTSKFNCKYEFDPELTRKGVPPFLHQKHIVKIVSASAAIG